MLRQLILVVRCVMNYLISQNANRSFPAEPVGYKPAVLIEASTAKIRQFYSLTTDGELFFDGPNGVENSGKLQRAKDWITQNQTVWAPVIDARSSNVNKFFFADGRHTFVALEQAGYKCIQIVVPQDRAQELQSLLSCGHR